MRTGEDIMAIKIYIDQGHNPENPNAGAVGNGLREQDITYRVGQELATLLRADPDYEVRLSRPTPTSSLGSSNSTSLRARVDDANAWGADYFISIHTNASSNSAASGTEAFAYSEPSRAFSLGEDIVEGITSVTGLRDRGMKVRPGLYVLRRTAMPAVLRIIEDGSFGEAPLPDAAYGPECTQVSVTIREGKFHQIKRMFAAVGKEVLYLKRLSMGPLQLDTALKPGQFRELTKEEIAALREH
jgi:N-acetylmuramoyl-L-alanine amidase